MSKIQATPEDLRRLVEAPWFEWMPGMLVNIDGRKRRLLRAHRHDDGETYLHFPSVTYIEDGAPAVPSDSATAGCLLEMYRRQCGGALSFFEGAHDYASLGDFVVAVLLDGA